MKSYRNSLQYSSVSFKKDTHIFTIKKHLQRGKLGGYNTAIESTDSFQTIDIINRIEESHAFSLSRESLRNLFSVDFYQIGNQHRVHIMCRLGGKYQLTCLEGFQTPCQKIYLQCKKIILAELVSCSWMKMQSYRSRYKLTTEKFIKVSKNLSKSNRNISFGKVV